MTTLPSPRPAAPGLSGRHVLFAMLVFFGVIVAADATMIYKAVSTFGGVDNANAYRDGLAYNKRIAGETRQAALGWRGTIDVLSEPSRLRIAMKDAAGDPPSALRIEASLGRPATNASDRELHLDETAPGTFEAPLGDALEPGTWIVTAKIFRTDAVGSADPVYRIRRRLWLSP